MLRKSTQDMRPSAMNERVINQAGWLVKRCAPWRVDDAGGCGNPDSGPEARTMTFTDPRSRFELAEGELRRLGITLRRLPGEYCVNFRYAGEKTARYADDLDQALELGRAMAAEAAAKRAMVTKPLRRRRRRRSITGKTPRRRFIRRRYRPIRRPRRQSVEQ
jgi:hypothetical protein